MDFEDKIKEFFFCSLDDNFQDFDFDEFFDEFEILLERKLAAHGWLGGEKMREYYEDMNADMEDDIPSWARWSNSYIHISPHTIVDAIFEEMSKQAKDTFGFDDLMELYEKLQDRPTDLPRLISLFDACIHAEHTTGSIIEEVDIDLDDLRAEVEEEHEEMLEEQRQEQEKVEDKFPTNIRKFLVPDPYHYAECK